MMSTAPGSGNGEFALIARHFTRAVPADGPLALGIGDDCALLRVAPGQQLAVSSDLLVEGRHFLSTVAPERLGHKALAVNLSDLAACGAEPLAFTLSIALPRVDDAWLAAFARGLFALADAAGIALAGGDTTAGPLAIDITALGQVPPGQALLRSGARPGDELWVSGQLGDARLALEVFRGSVSLSGDQFETARRAMELPQPRNTLGLALRGVASAAIDLSDGLAGDLGHVLARSRVGAVVDADALPRSAVLAAQPPALQHLCLLAGGDDYELLFAAPPARRDDVLAAARSAGAPVTRIGRVEPGEALRIVDGRGAPVEGRWAGFDHFAG
jgi:thiamine-monophosphate kinase